MSNLTITISPDNSVKYEPTSALVTVGADVIFVNNYPGTVGLKLSKQGQKYEPEPLALIEQNQQFRSNLPTDTEPGQTWTFKIGCEHPPMENQGTFTSHAGNAYTVGINHNPNTSVYSLNYKKNGGVVPGIDAANAGDTVEFVSNLDAGVPVKVHFSPFTVHSVDVNEVLTLGSGTGSFTFHFSHELSGDWIDPSGPIIVN